MLKGYIQPVEVASVLGYDIEDAVLMADVALMVEYAEASIDDYCDTQFDNEPNITKEYDGAGHGMLTLGFYLRRLDGVYLLDSNGEVLETMTDVVAQPSPLKTGHAYRWIERRGLTDQYGNKTAAPRVFPFGQRNIRVVGDWGFEHVPVNVKQAICYAVKHFFDMRMFNDLTEFQAGLGRTIKFRPKMSETDLPRASKNLLSKWRNGRWMTD